MAQRGADAGGEREMDARERVVLVVWLVCLGLGGGLFVWLS